MRYGLLLLGFLLLILPARPAAAQASALYFPPTTGSTWATTTPASLGWCQPPLDSLLAFVGRKGSNAFIILKDGRLVVEQYYGTYTADSLHYWASAGKSLTATLMGLAQQDGFLSLSDSSSRYLGRGWTSATAAQEGRIQIRHQLTMTSGLDDSPPAPCDNESATPACLRYLATPATRWAYHTGAYATLEDAVTTATSSLTYTRYTSQRLGQRIGMSGFWFNHVFISRARDMARFGLFILARGTWNGAPILTDTAYFRAMTTTSQALNPSYGYLWWLNGKASYRLPGVPLSLPGAIAPSAPADMIAALGKNDQKIYVVPSLGLVVVRQGASAGATHLAVSSFDTELWTRIMAVFCRPTATTPIAGPASFQTFPNPSTTALTLRHSAPGVTRICLLDGLGRPVISQPVAGLETTISTAALAPGLYNAQWLDASGQVLARRKVARQ
jgi:CubicO group peptidase (beta-lactamase class C family)